MRSSIFALCEIGPRYFRIHCKIKKLCMVREQCWNEGVCTVVTLCTYISMNHRFNNFRVSRFSVFFRSDQSVDRMIFEALQSVEIKM